MVPLRNRRRSLIDDPDAMNATHAATQAKTPGGVPSSIFEEWPPSGTQALQRYYPNVTAAYTIDETSALAEVPRRMILLYWKHQMIEPFEPEAVDEPLRFSGETILTLRLMEHLRIREGLNLPGIRWVLRLNREIERLGNRFASSNVT